LEKVGVHLLALDPQAVLQRGYALVLDKQGKLIDSVEKTSENETVDIHLQDGALDASVLKVKYREN
jgi:exodeoxyribonuclease VII large subunit